MPRKSAAQLDREIAEALAATSSAGLYDPKRLRAVSRATQHEKRKDIEERFPIGSYVKGTRFAFKDQLGKVTGYDLGRDEDAPEVKIRFVTPIPMGTHVAKTATLGDDAIQAVSKEQMAVDRLLARFKALDEKRVKAAADLREAARQSDRVTIADKEGRPVDPEQRKAAAKRWAQTVRAEKAVTTKMRDLVIQIRAIDPARVPWGWQNTR